MRKHAGDLAKMASTHPVAAPALGDLAHSGQFAIGPVFLDRFDTWQRIPLSADLLLSAHPTLTIEQRSDGDRALTLIGYLIDPENPDYGNQEILGELLARFSSFQALIDATASLGGRWLLVAQHGRATYFFHDPLGLRQAFFTVPPETRGELWVISQPGLVVERFDLRVDPAAQDFIASPIFARQPEYKWPGTASPFRAVKHLLPNHYLDATTATAHRYWPHRPLAPVSLEAALEPLSIKLRRLLEAAAKRYPLALGVTAGWDSRLVLAACKEIRREMTFVSLRQHAMAADHPDLAIPSRMLQRMNLPHEVVTCNGMSPSFQAMYETSVHMAHPHYGPDVETILRRFGRRLVAVTGSGWEVCRGGSRIWMPVLERRPSPQLLSLLEFGGMHPFTVDQLREWAAWVPRDMNVLPLEIFEWEQGHGNWLANTQLEFDIAWRDIFVPFNCRELIQTMLSLPEQDRNPPDYRVFRRLIAGFDPSLLEEPVNPHKVRSSAQYHVRNAKFLAKYVLKRAQALMRGQLATVTTVIESSEELLPFVVG